MATIKGSNYLRTASDTTWGRCYDGIGKCITSFISNYSKAIIEISFVNCTVSIFTTSAENYLLSIKDEGAFN